MLTSEIQSRVKNIFGDTSGAQINDPMILDWIVDGQKDICRKAECLEAPYTANIVAGTDQYAYPTDFIKEQRLTVGGLKLARLTMQSIDILYPDRAQTPASGNPLYYFHWARKLNLYPIPGYNITSGLVLWYIRYAAPLGSTPEIPDLYHEDLVRYCLIRAHETDQEWAATQQAKAEYDSRLLQTIYDSQVDQAEEYPSVRLVAGDW